PITIETTKHKQKDNPMRFLAFIQKPLIFLIASLLVNPFLTIALSELLEKDEQKLTDLRNACENPDYENPEQPSSFLVYNMEDHEYASENAGTTMCSLEIKGS